MGAYTHLIIGAGHMGGALLSGWLKAGMVKARHVILVDPEPGTLACSALAQGARHVPNLQAVQAEGIDLSGIELGVLAIKPQILERVLAEWVGALAPHTLIMSILAGISLRRLHKLAPRYRFVRAMPNLPAVVQAGVCGFVADEQVSAAQKARIQVLLTANGTVYELEAEELVDRLTAISGSGPAYIFHMVEALQVAACEVGLEESLAAELARQTVIGAGRMLAESPQSSRELRMAVSSPQGTTQAALDILMGKGEAGLTALMCAAVQAAFERAQALSRALDDNDG